MELTVFLIFTITLIISLMLKVSVVYALAFGVVLFGFYAYKKGYPLGQVWKMILSGIATSKTILLMLMLIGMMTALWRSAGTIAYLITIASRFVHPKTYLMLVFLLNALMSTLTGTAFGTAGTMGVITTAIGLSMNLPIFWLGGAVLSGSYLGDRSSPIATSALLVCQLTKTDLYTNIRLMHKTALVPYILTTAFYALVGLTFDAVPTEMNLGEMFSRVFVFSPLVLLPAVSVLVFALCKVNVRISLAVSTGLALLLCLFVQKNTPAELLHTAILGYACPDDAIASLVDGGGLVSMMSVVLMIFFASAFSGIMQETDMLRSAKSVIVRWTKKFGEFPVIVLISLLVTMLSCSQTLAIILTHQLFEGEADGQKLAIDYENSVELTAVLIPWCVAGSVPLASIGAPMTSLFAAVFLFILPIWYGIRRKKFWTKQMV